MIHSDIHVSCCLLQKEEFSPAFQNEEAEIHNEKVIFPHSKITNKWQRQNYKSQLTLAPRNDNNKNDTNNKTNIYRWLLKTQVHCIQGFCASHFLNFPTDLFLRSLHLAGAKEIAQRPSQTLHVRGPGLIADNEYFSKNNLWAVSSEYLLSIAKCGYINLPK